MNVGMLDTPGIIVGCLATSSLDFSEIITRYYFILEENIFLMLPLISCVCLLGVGWWSKKVKILLT